MRVVDFTKTRDIRELIIVSFTMKCERDGCEGTAQPEDNESYEPEKFSCHYDPEIRIDIHTIEEKVLICDTCGAQYSIGELYITDND